MDFTTTTRKDSNFIIYKNANKTNISIFLMAHKISIQRALKVPFLNGQWQFYVLLANACVALYMHILFSKEFPYQRFFSGSTKLTLSVPCMDLYTLLKSEYYEHFLTSSNNFQDKDILFFLKRHIHAYKKYLTMFLIE